ncbi:hypothetical protein SAMN05428988_0217 [Chitinophaga sp. YR573]|nr:hypothetical protein SAMN05428988_0217 [Chitinophaga sp. YR573]
MPAVPVQPLSEKEYTEKDASTAGLAPLQAQADGTGEIKPFHLANTFTGQSDSPQKQRSQEAWHVVQQKKTHVAGAMVDQMGNSSKNSPAPIQKRDFIPFTSIRNRSNVSQLKNAVQGGVIPAGYKEIEKNTGLYNANRVYNGNTYEKEIDVADSNLKTAIAGYIAETRVIGNNLKPKQFFDKVVNMIGPPNDKKWKEPGEKEKFIDSVRAHLDSDKANDNFDTVLGTRHKASTYAKAFNANRENFRDKGYIGFIDPFVVVHKMKKDKDVWTYKTVFSNSAFGYIVAIEDPTIGRGEIKPQDTDKPPKADSYEALQNVPRNNPNDTYIYSAAHRNSKISDDLAAKGANDEQGKYHERFDAITRLGAEGARFMAIEKAGDKVQWDTRFYGTKKYYEYGGLLNKWGEWFGRAYGVDNATMTAEIDARGTAIGANHPRLGVDFMLATDDFAK